MSGRTSEARPALPSEPPRLRAELAGLARERPEEAQEAIAGILADRLWRRWRSLLAPRGMRPRDLRAILRDYERETWLWVLGDREWAAMIEGLVGRIERRIDEAAGARR